MVLVYDMSTVHRQGTPHVHTELQPEVDTVQQLAWLAEIPVVHVVPSCHASLALVVGCLLALEV